MTSGGRTQRPPNWQASQGHHIYGRGAAQYWVAATNADRVPVLVIEGARAHATQRGYRWAEKIRFRLKPNELPLLAGVLLGDLPDCSFEYHGRAGEKLYRLSRQSPELGGAWFSQLIERGRPACAVPIPTADVVCLAGLAVGQLRAAGLLDRVEDLGPLLKRLVGDATTRFCQN